MKELKIYKSFDGKKFKSKAKAEKHETDLLLSCFRFDYGNETTGETSEGIKEILHSDFPDYAVDACETVKNLRKLLER